MPRGGPATEWRVEERAFPLLPAFQVNAMRSWIGPSAAFLLGVSIFACGSSARDDGAGPNPDPSVKPPGTPPPATTGPTPAVVDQKPVALSELVAGFDTQIGFYQGAQKRIFSIPQTLSASLARVTVATVIGTKVTVATLPVKGKVVTGRVEAMAYDPASDVFALIVRAQRPARIEVVTIKLGAADATFATLAQSPPQANDGYMFNAMYAKGAETFLAQRGDMFLTLGVAGGKATWGAQVTAQGFMRGNGGSISYDAPRGRFVAFGKDVFVPPMSMKFQPTIGTSSVDAPTAWNELTLGNAPADPPNPGGGVYAKWAAWDSQGQRLFTVIPQSSTCFPGQPPPCQQQQLWVGNLATNTWTKLQDHYNPPNAYRTYAVDDDNRRFFGVGDGAVSATSISDLNPAQGIALTQDGDVGPGPWGASATVLTDGKLLESDGGVFRVYDPAAAAPRWERFGKSLLPQELRYRPSFSTDPSSGEVMVFGGASSNASPASGLLYALAKDGSALTKLDVAGAWPSARTAHGAVFTGRTLVVAGGSNNQASGANLDDVWTLDRGTAGAAWKKAATLPTALGNVVLNATSATEVLALGASKTGSDYTIAPIVTIDLKTGTTKNLPVHGADSPKILWSIAPLGTCFVAFESGTEVDGSLPTLWRCKKDGDGIIWEKSGLDADDYSLGGGNELRGASTADGTRAFFIGATTWATAALTK